MYVGGLFFFFSFFFPVELLLIYWGYLFGFTFVHSFKSYLFFNVVTFQISNVNEKLSLVLKKIMQYGIILYCDVVM